MNLLSSDVMIKALDSLMLRESVTAENIANASTPHYRPRAVSFEKALAQAASKGRESVQSVVAKIGPDFSQAADEGVRLDQQLVTAQATAGRYGAVAEIMDRMMQIDELAITGGR